MSYNRLTDFVGGYFDVLREVLCDLVQMGAHFPFRLRGIPGQNGVHNVAVGHDGVAHKMCIRDR